MKRLSIITAALALALVFTDQVRAAEVTDEQSDGSTVSGERSYTGKTSKEDKDSAGRKRQKSKTYGTGTTESDSKKKAASASRGHSLDAEASLMSLFESPLDELAPLPPLLPADVGLTAELQPGYIDTIKANMLKELAASNAAIKTAGADQDAVTRYALAVANRGAIAAQAARNLADDIAKLQKKRPGKGGEFALTTIGAADLELLAAGAVKRVFKDGKPVITDADIKHRLKSITDRIERGRGGWRFTGTPERLTPGGGVELVLGAAPTLSASGANWYAPANSSFAGYAVTYKVSSSWSLVDSLELLKQNEKTKKAAYEISAYAEQLDSTGHSQEAAALRKQAVESAEHGKAILTPTKFMHMPGAAGGGH